MQRGTLVFHQTKNGERRSAPLVGHAAERMRAHAKVRRLDTDLVFPGSNRRPLEIAKMFREASARAGIRDFHFHDLRHAAASYLAMNGATLAEIAEVLGHKTLQMVKRYAHLTEGHTRDVVERMNNRIFGS
jgi:integrase